MKFKILCLLISLSLAATALRKVPLPFFLDSKIEASPGDIINLRSNKFPRANLKAYQVYIFNSHGRFRLRPLSVNSDSIQLHLPSQINYGVYNLSIKLQSRYLRSRKIVYLDYLKLAPRAPLKPELRFQVLSDLNNLDNILKDNIYQGHILSWDSNLQIGLNQIQTFYFDNGFQSLRSEPVNLFYFPEGEASLEIRSGKALVKVSSVEYPVDSIVNFSQENLTQSYYLISDKDPRYLLQTIQLSPVYISNIVIMGAESITLTNRSPGIFALDNCYLKDDLKSRHSFGSGDLVEAGNSITITKTLGLNDTGPDSMSLICSEQLIDKYSY